MEEGREVRRVWVAGKGQSDVTHHCCHKGQKYIFTEGKTLIKKHAFRVDCIAKTKVAGNRNTTHCRN
jgi:hypothetical protein